MSYSRKTQKYFQYPFRILKEWLHLQRKLPHLRGKKLQLPRQGLIDELGQNTTQERDRWADPRSSDRNNSHLPFQ